MLQTTDFFLLKLLTLINLICSFHFYLNLILIFVHVSTLYFHTIWISLKNKKIILHIVILFNLHQGFLKHTRSVSSCICTYMRNRELQKVTLRPLINASFHFLPLCATRRRKYYVRIDEVPCNGHWFFYRLFPGMSNFTRNAVSMIQMASEGW